MSGLAGTLRERVTIARRNADRDDLAGASGDWGILAVRFAAVAPDGHGEAVAGDAASAAERYVVTIRAGVAVLPGDRIGWAGRTMAVRGVTVDPARPDRMALKVEALR